MTNRIASRWTRPVLLALFVVAGLGSVVFGLRAYHSFLLLRSAYELGAPKISTIRPWMTVGYVAGTYRAPSAVFVDRLGLPPDTDPDTSLRSLASREGVSPFLYVQRVQRALAAVVPGAAGDTASASTTWISAVEEELLAAVLVYGYPALGLTLLLGAIGLPLPTGLSTVVAGSLSAVGKLSWALAALVALTASVSGDAVGYALGRLVSREFLERRARWLGYTAARHARVESLFNRWGGLSVLLSRTLISHLSSIVNVFAGASRYRLDRFLMLAVLGRLLWTSAYLGLGYAAGTDLEAASSFLANLSLLLAFLATLIGTGLVASGRLATVSHTSF
jgi:membrane protein DedA with SNARE-associated domain